MGVDGDNHQSGLLGCPRISARVKVPGRENLGRFVVEDCLPDRWEEFLFILREETKRETVNAYLLVIFFFFSFFVIKSLLCLKVQKTHAALAMEIKNL